MDVKRESVVGGATVRTAPTAAATVTVVTVMDIEGKALMLFRELIVRMEVTRAMTGSSPTMDVYLQRAIRPDPDATDDNDWEDWLHFPQVTTAAMDKVAYAPAALPAATTAHNMELRNGIRDQAVESMGDNRLVAGHWGDRLRVREKITGTVTQAAQWHLHLIGM